MITQYDKLELLGTGNKSSVAATMCLYFNVRERENITMATNGADLSGRPPPYFNVRERENITMARTSADDPLPFSLQATVKPSP